MQEKNPDPKIPGVQENIEDRISWRVKRPWHAPVLQRLDVALFTATHYTRHARADGYISQRS